MLPEDQECPQGHNKSETALTGHSACILRRGSASQGRPQSPQQVSQDVDSQSLHPSFTQTSSDSRSSAKDQSDQEEKGTLRLNHIPILDELKF